MAATVLRSACATVAALILGACATLPSGPSMPALPGSLKTADQFTVDHNRCRAIVIERLAGGTPTDAAGQNGAGSAGSQEAWASTQQQFDGGYYACMYSFGHKVPVPASDVARYRVWLESVAPPR